MRYDLWAADREAATVTESGLKVLASESIHSGKPTVKIFRPKATKPSAHYIFRSVEQRDQFVANYQKTYAREMAAKAERKVASKGTPEKVESITVGSIFSTSWGYDQTNVEFFEVVARSGRRVTIRELAQSSEPTGWLTERVTPIKGKYVSGPIKKLLHFSPYGVGISFESYRSGSLWDGKPKSASHYA